MTEQFYFTDANRIPPPGGLERGQLPTRLRAAFSNYLETTLAGDGQLLLRWAVNELDLTISTTGLTDLGSIRALQNVIRNGEWDDVLSLMSSVRRNLVGGARPRRADHFRNFLNGRFLRYYSAYQMDESGRIVEPAAAVTERALGQARAILRDGAFNGPDPQFQGALEDFYRAPNPNYEGAVESAINATEGVARIVLADRNVLLSAAMKRIGREHNLHRALTDSIIKLYGYASDAGGRHGLVGDPDVDRPIAEFCLHQCAAAIVFMARLYGHNVVEAATAGTPAEG